VNHWLHVPLADYEGHMTAAGVEQLAPLAGLFRQALARTNPESVAILGIAGGNGLEHIDPATTTRTVGIDINPAYLEVVAQRHPNLHALELHHHDLAEKPIDIPPVDLVHAALVFEHAGTGQCLENAIRLLSPKAHLSVVLQLPSESQTGVAPTPYASLQSLKETFQHIDPAWLVQTLATRGLHLKSETRHPLPSGKAFWMGLFRFPPSDSE
jgi:threonine dehydrogenase-like Zn-dependent dehydrogenase